MICYDFVCFPWSIHVVGDRDKFLKPITGVIKWHPFWRKWTNANVWYVDIYSNFKGFPQKRVVHRTRWCHRYYITPIFNVKKLILEPRKAAGVPLDDLVLTHLLEACRLGSSHKKTTSVPTGGWRPLWNCHLLGVKRKHRVCFFWLKSKEIFMKGWWYDTIWCSHVCWWKFWFVGSRPKNIMVIWLFFICDELGNISSVSSFQCPPWSVREVSKGPLPPNKNKKQLFQSQHVILYPMLLDICLVFLIYVGDLLFVADIFRWTNI